MRILFLPHRVPYPPDKGDRIRSYHLLRFLSRLGTVDLATLADEPVSDVTVDELRRHCGRVAVIPIGASRWAHGAASWLRGRAITEGIFRSGRLASKVRQWSSEVAYDAVVVVCSSMVQYIESCAGPTRNVIVDLIDVDSKKWSQYAEVSQGLRQQVYSSEAKRLQMLEAALPDRVGAVTLVSEAEVDLFRTVTSRGYVYAVPNGVDLDYFTPDSRTGNQEDSNSIVFVGALNYQPNVEGLLWFCEHVWPRLREHHSTAVFRVVGRQPTNRVRALSRVSGVDIVGEVEDVRPYVRRSSVVVVPLTIARGIQNKVLESLAMGKPVVASYQALTGIDLTSGVHAIQADSPDEWVSATAQLWHDRTSRAKLGVAGRSFVESNHSWDDCLSTFAHLLGLADGCSDDRQEARVL